MVVGARRGAGGNDGCHDGGGGGLGSVVVGFSQARVTAEEIRLIGLI